MTGRAASLFTLVFAALTSSPAAAQTGKTNTEGGIEVALRLGYGVAGGKATGAGTYQNAYVQDVVPAVVDAGYRIRRALFVGAYFQYAIGSEDYAFPTVSCFSPVDCSTRSIRTGLEVSYHYLPNAWYDPWVGAGFGYEWTTVSLRNGSRGPGSGFDAIDLTASGFELANVQAGLDMHVTRRFSVGPFVSFSVNRYDHIDIDCEGPLCDWYRSGLTAGNPSQYTCDSLVCEPSGPTARNPTIHVWFIVGVRGAFVGFSDSGK